jgi:AbiV family abortive infection protein
VFVAGHPAAPRSERIIMLGMTSQVERLSQSVEACVSNGKKLIEDASLLFDSGRFSTALALALLAQEELSKAFILQLVVDGAVPWIQAVRQSISRHQCKHLLAIVMDWLPNFDDWLDNFEQRKLVRPTTGEEFRFPSDVATALNIYRHEEIERIRSGDPWKDDDWATGNARKIADGSLDRKKQAALYVHITKNGGIGLHPGLITSEEAKGAIQRAKRLSDLPLTWSPEYERLKNAMIAVFANLSQKQPLHGNSG